MKDEDIDIPDHDQCERCGEFIEKEIGEIKNNYLTEYETDERVGPFCNNCLTELINLGTHGI